MNESSQFNKYQQNNREMIDKNLSNINKVSECLKLSKNILLNTIKKV